VVRDETRRAWELADVSDEIDRVGRTGGEKIARTRHQHLLCWSESDT
jgi:hypothetical protein